MAFETFVALYKTNLKGPIALVIGSEGFGIKDLVKKNCDDDSDYKINPEFLKRVEEGFWDDEDVETLKAALGEMQR